MVEEKKLIRRNYDKQLECKRAVSLLTERIAKTVKDNAPAYGFVCVKIRIGKDGNTAYQVTFKHEEDDCCAMCNDNNTVEDDNETNIEVSGN